MSVTEAVERDLSVMPENVSQSGLAAMALTMAGILDDPKNSATSRSMCAKALQDALRELRALAPAKRERDELDELRTRHASRRSGIAGT
jgi:hypothetical protein